jgi:hypothetical protein
LVALARAVPSVSKTPQIQMLVAAVTLNLLGYVLYTGYDHVDSGRITSFNRFGINIPNRVEGVRETVQTIGESRSSIAMYSLGATQMMQHRPTTVVDYSRYISERTTAFTGRQWVFERLNTNDAAIGKATRDRRAAQIKAGDKRRHEHDS